jgi:hypothetical protein
MKYKLNGVEHDTKDLAVKDTVPVQKSDMVEAYGMKLIAPQTGCFYLVSGCLHFVSEITPTKPVETVQMPKTTDRVYQPWEVADEVQRFCGPNFPLISYYAYRDLEIEIRYLKSLILAASNCSKGLGKHGMDMFAHSDFRKLADKIETERKENENT